MDHLGVRWLFSYHLLRDSHSGAGAKSHFTYESQHHSQARHSDVTLQSLGTLSQRAEERRDPELHSEFVETCSKQTNQNNKKINLVYYFDPSLPSEVNIPHFLLQGM